MKIGLYCLLLLGLVVSRVGAEAAETLALWPVGHAALEGLDPKDSPSLTLYRPPASVKPAPVILIVCPGGGYGMQSMGDEGHSVAAWYAKHGITGVVLKYRLPQRGKWSPKKEYSTLRDAQRAVQLMRWKAKDLGMTDPKVGIMGFSAGGHLACMTATRWRPEDAKASDAVEKFGSRPDFACLIYPVVSMMEHTHGGSRDNLLGPDPTEEDRKTYPGEFNVSKDTPPIFMVHADNDSVKSENSVQLYQALHKAGLPVEMHIVSRGNHGFYDGKGWGIPGNESVRFTTAGSMWPEWTLNWMLEERLVKDPESWQWTQTQRAIKALLE